MTEAAVDPGKARLLHTMLRVKDLDKSLNFYTELLGMKLLRKRDYPTGKFTLAFVGYGDETDSTVIELTHNWEQAEPYQLGSAFGHLAIGVPDVYKTCEKLGCFRRQDPASGRADGAWRLGDRLYRGPGRLPDRVGRARLNSGASGPGPPRSKPCKEADRWRRRWHLNSLARRASAISKESARKPAGSETSGVSCRLNRMMAPRQIMVPGY